MLRTSFIRTQQSLLRPVESKIMGMNRLMVRYNSTPAAHAIATPLISKLPERWDSMPVEEQVEITGKIWERQKAPWTDLTLDEKRASFFISYGPWGPRKPMHKPGDGYRIVGGIILGLAATTILFAIARSFAAPDPKTLNKEWQAASDKLYHDGYTEPFNKDWSLVQSLSKKDKGEEEEDDE
ncbi:cytochrome c oxidase subunit IV-domain-containing protein [Dipodascopsis uninucleata]